LDWLLQQPEQREEEKCGGRRVGESGVGRVCTLRSLGLHSSRKHNGGQVGSEKVLKVEAELQERRRPRPSHSLPQALLADRVGTSRSAFNQSERCFAFPGDH
jgi:hypothetical protein